MNSKIYLNILLAMVILLLISGLLAIKMPFLHSLRLVFGSVYVLFLPGLFVSYIFFPPKRNALDWIERVVFSFAISLALVPLVMFYFNWMGMKITTLSVGFVVLAIIILSIAIILLKNRFIGLQVKK